MIISNIQNLITICEETTPTYIPSSPGLPSPSSVTAPPSIRSKYFKNYTVIIYVIALL